MPNPLMALRAWWRRVERPRFLAAHQRLPDGTVGVTLIRYRLERGWLGPRVVAEDVLASARFSPEQAFPIDRCISQFSQAAELANRGELGAAVRTGTSAGRLWVALVDHVLTPDGLRREVLEEDTFDPHDEDALIACSAYRSELEAKAEDLALQMRPGTGTAAEAHPPDTSSLVGSRWWNLQHGRRLRSLERHTR